MTHRTGQPHEMTADVVLVWRAAVWPILERLCVLQEEVCDHVLGWDDANDCFCGLGGFWAMEGGGAIAFRSEFTALAWVEQAVRARIAAHKADAPGSSGQELIPQFDETWFRSVVGAWARVHAAVRGIGDAARAMVRGWQW